MSRLHEFATGKREDRGAALYPLQNEKRGFFEGASALSISTSSFPVNSTALAERFRTGSEGRAISIYEMAIQALTDIQANHVVMKNPGEVLDYIFQHPGIVGLLQSAVRTARQQFPDAHFTLQVYHDPEIEDAYLVLYVRTETYDETFLERMKQIDHLLDQLPDGDGWLLITTDFRKPGRENPHGKGV